MIEETNRANTYSKSVEDLKRRIENLDSMNHDTLFDTFVDMPEGSFAIAFPEKWFNEIPGALTQNVGTTLDALQCIQEENEGYENHRL